MSNLILKIRYKNKEGVENNEKEIKAPVYIPNLGESVHNENDLTKYYNVTAKDCFYYDSLTVISIVATEK